MVEVVFPTPPFWFAIAIIFPILFFSYTCFADKDTYFKRESCIYKPFFVFLQTKERTNYEL